MAGRASWHGCALIALILLLPAASPSLCWSAGEAFMNDPAAAFAPWSPAVSAVLEANLLYLEGRYDEALAILRPLVSAPEPDMDALFLFGLVAVKASEQPGLSTDRRAALLDAASSSFHTMLVARPGLVRVRLELARALFLKGEDDLSRRYFEHVLAGNPPPAVVANVRGFLGQIRARRRWSLYAGFALAPDTNIGGASEEEVIQIFGLPFQREAEKLTTSGIGVLAWGGGEYQHPLGADLRLRAGADISLRDYTGRGFDQVHVSGHVGPRWLIGRDSEVSVLADVQRHWSVGAPEHDALGGRVEAGHRLTQSVRVNAQASWLERRYRMQTFQDGPALSISLGGVWTASPTVRADAGVGWGRERPESLKWRHEHRWIRAGVSVDLPRGFTVGGGGHLRWTDYEGDWFPHTDGRPREDLTRKLRLSVHHRKFSWKGFSPKLSLVHEVRSTNAQLYDYRRTSGEMSIVRLF